MVRLAMTSELSNWIADRIAAFPNESSEHLQELSPCVVRYAALPLYVGWWDTVAIKANGDIVSWSTDDEYSGYSGVRLVEDRYLWLTALVAGSQHYEQLKTLLPVRTATAIDCRHAAHPVFASGKVFCPECFGLGWVEPPDRGRTSQST